MSTSSSPPELKWNRFDSLVALAVVLLAVVSALCSYLPKNQSGALTVVIDISGQEVRRVPLSDFTEATVTSRGYTLHIAAEGGAVSVTDSDCPTQDCVHTGAISRAGQSIVCLPAQVVVHLEGGGRARPPPRGRGGGAERVRKKKKHTPTKTKNPTTTKKHKNHQKKPQKHWLEFWNGWFVG